MLHRSRSATECNDSCSIGDASTNTRTSASANASGASDADDGASAAGTVNLPDDGSTSCGCVCWRDHDRRFRRSATNEEGAATYGANLLVGCKPGALVSS